MSRGNLDGARARLQQFDDVAVGFELPAWLSCSLIATKADLFLAAGETQAAADLLAASGIDGSGEIGFLDEAGCLSLARLHIQRGDT